MNVVFQCSDFMGAPSMGKEMSSNLFTDSSQCFPFVLLHGNTINKIIDDDDGDGSSVTCYSPAAMFALN